MDRQTCLRHKEVAAAALQQLQSLKIKSANKLWQYRGKVDRAVGTQRLALGYDWDTSTDVGLAKGEWRAYKEDDEFMADMAFSTGAGNCDEKASVFGTLASRNSKSRGSSIFRCEFTPYDHVIAIMCTSTDLRVGRANLPLSAFGDDAIVLDGWSEDWWFPNVGTFDTLRDHLWRAGNPFAMKVRQSSRGCNRLIIKSKMT